MLSTTWWHVFPLFCNLLFMRGVFFLPGKGCLNFACNQLVYCFFPRQHFVWILHLLSIHRFLCLKMSISMLKSQPSEAFNTGGRMKAGDYKMSLNCWLLFGSYKGKEKSLVKMNINEILAFYTEQSAQPLFHTVNASQFNSNCFHCGNRKTIWDKGCSFANAGDMAVVYHWTLRWDSDIVVTNT